MVKVYTKNNCPQCKKTKRLFKFSDIAFEEINVEEDEQSFNYVKHDLGLTTLPVIEVDGQDAFGYNEGAIKDFVKMYRK